MGQMTADQYLDQIQNQLMKTLTEKKDAMPPGFNQQRFALNCITVIRDMMKDYKKREQLQTVDINSIVLCMIKGAYLGLDFLNGECYAIPYKGEMTFQTDYKGEIKVCKRFSDDPIKDIYAKVVREPEIPFDPKPSQTVRITGSPEDYQKVIEYIKAMGIDYEEV